MTREEIIRMALEAGIDAESDTLCRYEGWVEPLERFAALVAAAAKAEVCDDKAPPCPTCVSLARTVMMDQVGKA